MNDTEFRLLVLFLIKLKSNNKKVVQNALLGKPAKDFKAAMVR